MEQQDTQQTPWYKQRWPWLLMIGPAWVVVGAIIMITLASRTPDALVVDDYYKRGKAINQDLSRDRAAAERQLQVEARYNPASERLEGVLSAAGKPMAAALDIQLVHSTQPDKDLKLAARSDGEGRFSVPLPMLERARWQVIVEGEGRTWRLTGEWRWPDEQDVTLVADAERSPLVH
jgi:hypothetical protein